MDIRDSDFFLEEETLRTMKTLSEQVSDYLGQVTITMQEMGHWHLSTPVLNTYSY